MQREDGWKWLLVRIYRPAPQMESSGFANIVSTEKVSMVMVLNAGTRLAMLCNGRS